MSNFLIFLILLTFSAVANSNLLDEFQAYEAPKPASILWHCESWADFVWAISNRNGQISVKKLSFEELYSVEFNSAEKHPEFNIGKYVTFPRRFEKVGDGYLVGYNKGEWGGALYWFSKDYNHYYKVADKQITSFIKKGSDMYALEGLSHMSFSDGSFIKIVKTNNRWGVETLSTLPGAPGPYSFDQDQNILLVSGNSVVQLNLNGELEILHKSKTGLGRSSSILKEPSGRIYIGAGATIIQLSPTSIGYEEKWLIKEEDISDCKCRYVPVSENHNVVRCD